MDSSSPPFPVGRLSSEGKERYLLEADSTTGYVAWRLADGTTLISNAKQVSLGSSPLVSFWSCASYTDTMPAGQITCFDCHGNSLTRLDVRALTALRSLDCSFNKLTELPLDGLTELEVLDAESNRLKKLEVRSLNALRVLNCAANKLTELNLTGMNRLQVVECTGNAFSRPNGDKISR